MTHATVSSATIDPTIAAAEAEHFGRLAEDWWNPKGTSAMLHRLNPVRLRYIREAVDAHWDGDPASFTPLAGRRALDVGCGAGLLAEPLARLGAVVTGVDAAAENIAVARAHAAEAGLAIDYRHGGVDAVDDAFNLVTCMEVIEHVADRAAFARGLAARVGEGGLLVMSTPNRTAVSRVALVEAAERIGMVPRGTHDWHRFLTPAEMTALLAEAGLTVTDVRGLTLTTAGFALGASTALNYLVTAVR
ncbi:bifunctional 2-polyprenyl-6-hydroxyphenol methylase/3-demethylubiquinol 3-O-methyltransferase UbiG [Sphingomonas sp.]|uniref:bifunctional 2-polyprenyl-6-hydroxyphenol methylase/3-demethylubiquinol 3-O-methyltransferase UbiG n=1 Tax=Sphingomonas sp. TaxID=28214 RepID=UPI0035C7E394